MNWKSLGMFVMHFLCGSCSLWPKKTNMEFQEDHCLCILSKSESCSIPCVSLELSTKPPRGPVCPPPRGTSWSLGAAVFRRRVPTCEAWGCRSKVASAAVIVLSIGSMVLLYMVTWIPSIYPLYVSIYIYIPYMDPMGLSIVNTRYVLMMGIDWAVLNYRMSSSCFLNKTIISPKL